MSNATECLVETKAIITNTCRILQEAQLRNDGQHRELYASSADCYVLLQDATRLLCRAVSELYGEPQPTHRWSPALPELLLSHPEKCLETLALMERAEFKEISYFHFVEV